MENMWFATLQLISVVSLKYVTRNFYD